MITNNLEVWQNGMVKPCCLYRGFTGNIDNYPRVIEIQRQINDTLSEDHAPCQVCWDHERMGIPSKREMSNDWQRLVDEGALFELPNILEIKLSNLCNLACTTCGAESSSIWANKLKIKTPNAFTKEGAAQRLENLIQLIDQRGVNEIQLIGGEPTVNPESFALLDRLIELGWNHRISIRLVTNGVDIERFMTKYYDKFLEFNISVSIDGKEDVFEYTRWGGKWSEVLAGLTLLGELQQKRHNKINVVITYTYSVLNLFHFSDFKQWYNTELPKLCKTNGLHVNRADFPRALTPKLYNMSWQYKLEPELQNAVEAFTVKDRNSRNSLYAELVLSRDLPRDTSYKN